MMKNIILCMAILVVSLLTGCSREEEFYDITNDESVTVRFSDNDSVGNISEEAKIKELPEENEGISAEDQLDSQPIVVFVCGEVNNPGVYELETGSRVIDALKAAGGYTEYACETYINLAMVLEDESMISIPSKDDVENIKEGDNESPVFGVSASETEKNDSKNNICVNINTASCEQLMTIPGIGQSKADKIIAYREEQGKFNTIEDIMNITGIKEGMFNKIKDYICVK